MEIAGANMGKAGKIALNAFQNAQQSFFVVPETAEITLTDGGMYVRHMPFLVSALFVTLCFLYTELSRFSEITIFWFSKRCAVPYVTDGAFSERVIFMCPLKIVFCRCKWHVLLILLLSLRKKAHLSYMALLRQRPFLQRHAPRKKSRLAATQT